MKKILTFAVLAATVTSCTQNEVEGLQQSNEYIGIASAKVNNLVLTRVGETTPLDQGSLGLFVTTEGDDIFSVDNMKWNYTEDAGWTSITNLAYEGDGKQTAYAYHPYRPEAATTSFNFTIDNERTDLLWWKSDGKLTSKTLNIGFDHALSKLTINLKKNEEVAGEELGAVTISGTKKNGIVDLTTQTWNTEAGEVAEITAGEVELTEGFDKTVCSTLIPQTVSALTVSVEVGSNTYTWTGTEQEFLSGHAYTLNLTVGREVAAIGEVNVTDWTLEETPKEGNADYVPSYLTGEDLRTYMAEQLNNGETDITVNLRPNAGYSDFLIIRESIKSESVEEGTINFTITGATFVPGKIFSALDEFYSETGERVDELKSVILPNVLEIGEYAFHASGVTRVEAPKVITIGQDAFNGTKLTEISFPNVQEIERQAFLDCSDVTSINLPEVLKIGSYTFRGVKVVDLYLPKLSFVDICALWSMPLLTSVNLPEISTLSERLFEDCPALTTVIAPKVTSIGPSIFQNCPNITNVTLSAVEDITIDEYAWNSEPEGQEPTSVNEQIDLVLNKNKESEVTNGNEWKGFTFKSISFEE